MTATEDWLRRLKTGERRVLARLLSRVQSTKPDDERFVGELLKAAAPEARSMRVGVTGIPGAGKSTLIEALGIYFVDQGKRVAVLAVDPSSPVSGGSILGDKLRMPRLSQSPSAFVRPLANACMSGGGVYALDDCIRLCELSGYDVVMVETVGVGQNEIDVGLVCDATLLVVVPGTGDEIQALKRGLTEVVDMIVVNKGDLASKADLERVQSSYRDGVGYVRREPISVLTCSALSGDGLSELAYELEAVASSAALQQVRGRKRQLLLRRMIEHSVLRKLWTGLMSRPEFAELSSALEGEHVSLRHALQKALRLTENGPECRTYPPDQD